MNLVVGHPLEHSLSPRLHNFVYALEKIPSTMGKFAEADIEKVIDKIKNEDVLLTAVTMPHKEKIVDYLDEVEERAAEIGSVNTIINKQGKLFGYNTDLAGISRALEEISVKNKKVLILGAGGAARTAVFFMKENEGEIIIYNRTKEKAVEICNKFGGIAIDNFDFLDLESVDLIVNCTPIGMGKLKEQLPMPEKFLNRGQTVFDIVYNPAETKLLRVARIKGARTISGLEMFIEQGLEQINLVYGLKNDRIELRQKVKKELIEN